MRNLAINGAALRERGIVVCGTRLLDEPAAEHAWALGLALFKRVTWEDAELKLGGWRGSLTSSVSGKTLALLGLGKLGRLMARYGNAFSMNVIAWSPNLTKEQCHEAGVQLARKDELFARADLLSVHLILSARTRAIIGSAELALMKQTAFLVNTSRGGLIDENALIEALKDGGIAGAALDVFDQEPLATNHVFRRLPNVILSGHKGYQTWENMGLAYTDALEAVEGWLAGTPIRTLSADQLGNGESR